MEEVQIRIDENGDGGFYIIEENEQLGEMIVNKKRQCAVCFAYGSTTESRR